MGVTLGYKQTAEHARKRIDARMATLAKKPKPFEKQWLEARYVGEQMDCAQIGRLAERDPKTIWSWLRYYGIPTRPRGSNVGQLPKGRAAGFSLSAEHKQSLRAARLKDGRAPWMKDGKHWLQHEGAVHPNWKGGITPERQAFYACGAWRESVKAVWKRADAKCERCGRHHNTTERRGTFHVHHIVSFAVPALRAEVSNLALLCKPCHLFVHSAKNASGDFIKDTK